MTQRKEERETVESSTFSFGCFNKLIRGFHWSGSGYRVENSKGDHSESPLGDFRGPFFWQKGDQKETFL